MVREPDLRWMRTVVVVAQEGSLRAAGRRLSLSQPAVSQQVRALESALGVVVLDRDRRGATLTAAGRDLVAAMGDVEGALERLRAAMAVHQDRGPVRLGVPANLPAAMVPGAVAALRRQHPQVAVTLHGGPTSQQEPALVAGSVDVAIVRAPPEASHEGLLRWVELQREPLGVALAADHPSAGDGAVPLEAVRAATLFSVAARDVPGQDRDVLAAVGLDDHGDRRTGPDLATGLAMAATGFAMVLTTAQQVHRHQDPTLVWRPVEGVTHDYVTWVAWRRAGGPLVRELVTHLRRAAGPTSDPRA